MVSEDCSCSQRVGTYVLTVCPVLGSPVDEFHERLNPCLPFRTNSKVAISKVRTVSEGSHAIVWSCVHLFYSGIEDENKKKL